MCDELAEYAQDELIYEERDDTFYVGLGKTTSERFILIHLNSATTSEVLLLDADRAEKNTNTLLTITSSFSISVLTKTAKTLVYIRTRRRMRRSGKR